MTDFDDFLSNKKEFVGHKPVLERVEGKTYLCIICSEISVEVFFDPIVMSLYWYCKDGHESRVDLNVGKVGD